MIRYFSEKIDNSCQKVWIKETEVYKCFTCDSSQRLVVCRNCFIDGKHDGHESRLITSVNGSCGCGHSSGSIFCSKHPLMISNDIKNDSNLKEIEIKELIEITSIEEKEAKCLIDLNQIKKVLNHSSVWTLIDNYFRESQAKGQKPVKIVDIYSVFREDHENRFISCGYDRQRRLLLWHGTKVLNLTGILDNGFKLPTDGQLMFGKGIYFADRVTKSCDYCDPTGTGILLLCEVAVGSMYVKMILLLI